jgi:hypothetical protein
MTFCSAAPTLRKGEVHMGAGGRVHRRVAVGGRARRRAQIKAARHSLEATSYAPLLRRASRLIAVRNARRHVS